LPSYPLDNNVQTYFNDNIYGIRSNKITKEGNL
jgi:hypothetical protein